MPIKTCSADGKSGYKYGDSGHCYTGKDAKKKAIKQGLAIHYKQGTMDKFEKEMKSSGSLSKSDLEEIILDPEFTDEDLDILMDILNLNSIERLSVASQRKSLQ